MNRKKRNREKPLAFQMPKFVRPHGRPGAVQSLMPEMIDGKEYGSIVSTGVAPGFDILNDLVASVQEIEVLRDRPCVAYIGNVSNKGNIDPDTDINASDDTPFHEMIAQIPAEKRSVDILLASSGGSSHQVARFVNCLRPRFDEVEFLIPSFCMSAGTLFALSGNKIWMTERACLGPIDPQVPTKDGRFVPAQALLLLIAQLQKQGDDALKDNKGIPWTAVRVVDSLDKKELGDAMTATRYATQMATEFLKTHKFKSWLIKDTSRVEVTDDDRTARAEEIAHALASHDRWKNHGHAITREVLWTEVQLRIDHPTPELDRLMRRFWALCNWMFDKTPVMKAIFSPNYRFVRQRVQVINVAHE